MPVQAQVRETYSLLVGTPDLNRNKISAAQAKRKYSEVIELVDARPRESEERDNDLEVAVDVANNLLPSVQLESVWNEYSSILEIHRSSDAKGRRSTEVKEAALLQTYGALQSHLAASAGSLLDVLTRHYQDNPQLCDEPGDESSKQKCREVPVTAKELAEHFVSMVYINYIVTILLHIRTLAATAVGIFVLDVLAVNSYPFEPRAFLRTSILGVFAVITACFALVYGQMHRDPILSRMTDTKAGELGGDFWFRMLSLTGLPIASLLATEFPSIGNFLFSWIEPVLKTTH